MKKPKMFRVSMIFVLLFTTILFYEVTFRLAALERGIDAYFWRVTLFSFTYAAFLTFFLRFFKPALVKAFILVSLVLLNALYFSQTIYYLVMDNFWSVSALARAGVVIGFYDRIFRNFEWIQILFFVPLLAFIVYLVVRRRHNRKTFDIRYERPFTPFVHLLASFVLLLLAVQTISSKPLPDEDYDYIYSDTDLYEMVYSPRLSIDRFGLLTYTRINFRNMLKSPEEEEHLDELVERFFENREPHAENEYTGLFEDKNLIMILAESLDTFSIDPHLMPNLYGMKDNAFIFDNFYAPPYYQYTADTEFMMHTSYFPSADAENMLSMAAYLDNEFPETLPTRFREAGYHSIAHHNYTDHFYPRSDFHLNTIGFDEYYSAVDLGLLDEDFVPGAPRDSEEDIVGYHPWPSDLDMFEQSLDNILDHERFFAYYLTVSGHLPYDEDHPIAVRNLPIIEEIFADEDVRFQERLEALDKNLQETFLHFHAAHYELDLALGYLLERLEDEGRLEDTVIMIASDHFAYGIPRRSVEQYDDVKDLEETALNMHNVPFLIYNPSLERTHIDKTMSSVDVMPTLANLFGIELHHDRIMGEDVFREEDNTVVFVNSEFLNADMFYDLNKQDPIGIRTEGITEEQVLQQHNRIIHKQQLSRYILNTDYFGRTSTDPPEDED